LQVVDERYEEFTIKGKQSLKINICPPSNFQFKSVFEDEVFKGLELELLQINTGDKDEDSIEMI
jgi:hypothetical protein